MTYTVNFIYLWRLPLLVLTLISLYSCGYQLRGITNASVPSFDDNKIVFEADDPSMYQAASNAFSQMGIKLYPINLISHFDEADLNSHPTTPPENFNASSSSTSKAETILKLSNTKFVKEVRLYDANNMPKQWRLYFSTQLTLSDINHTGATIKVAENVRVRQLSDWMDLNINATSNITNNQALANVQQQLRQRMAQQILFAFIK